MIEMGKTYQTRDGREVRIYAVDAKGAYEIHGAIRDGVGWKIASWTPGGSSSADFIKEGSDLIEVKPKITRTYWLVHYQAGPVPRMTAWTSDPQRGPVYKDSGCIAITGPHQVEFIEGEGLKP